MRASTSRELKAAVRDYWNTHPCGTEKSSAAKYSRTYYDELEQRRYEREPEIFSFAQFTRSYGQRILEVGVGAGADFLQWVRSGAKAHGVDLTPEAIQHTERRLEAYGLKAEELRIADCESLPYEENSFDLVYSWGVIHHSPNTEQALRELVRVCRPGGSCKLMVYNRHSLVAFRLWLKYGLLAGKPWRSLSRVVYHHMESIGTKAYTRKEVEAMLSPLSVENVRIEPTITYYDVKDVTNKLYGLLSGAVARIIGDRFGWFLCVQFHKR